VRAVLKPGQTVFVDTAPLIYLFEGSSLFADKAAAFLKSASELEARLVSSMITYAELMVLPLRKGNLQLAGRYRAFLTNSRALSLHQVDLFVADRAAQLRAEFSSLKLPDAIQLATAEACGADLILTNDRQWPSVKGVKVVLLSDL